MLTLAAGLDYVDLDFLGVPEIIATAVLHGASGVALIDPGPSTTHENLKAVASPQRHLNRRRASDSADPHPSRPRRRHRRACAGEPADRSVSSTSAGRPT